MKRIFSFLFAIIALMGTTGVFTSCQEDAPEINYTINITVNNDFTEVVNAINNGIMKQDAAIAALTAAIEKMNGDQTAKLQALIEAINTMATTLDAKLAIIEAAMKAQTLSLENKLDLLTAAVDAQTLKQEEMAGKLTTAIDNLSGTIEDKFDAIEAIIEITSATLAEKLAAIEAAMKAQTLALETKLDLLEAAIKALPDYTDQLKAIEAAIKGMPDYSDKLAAIETALEAIADNIKAQEGQYADELAALTDAIDAITKAVEDGNKSQKDALAEIIALLESGAIAGGGSGSGGEGGEGESTYQSITITTSKAIGETIWMSVHGELAASEIEGADIVSAKPDGAYTDYRFELTSQTVTIKQASIEYIFYAGNQITSMDLNNCTDLRTLHCRTNEITGENMTDLVKDLPDRTGKTAGKFVVYATGDPNEKNVITKDDVAIAKAKNWNVLDWYENEYEGIDGEGEGEDEGTIPYVTFTADADQTLSYTGTDLQYSTDGTTFQNLPADTPISFGGNKELYLRGVNNLDGTDNGDYKGVISFGNDTHVACKGDIRTLIDYATYQTVKTNKAVFAYLFKKCTQLTSAPELPITDVASECYQSMFEHCYALQEAPALPATTVKVRSYAFMFSGCISLKEAPALPATNLLDQDRCYAYMFQYCYALEKAPELPATTLGAWCYEYMFEGCRSLTVAPTLPAKTLIIGCYLGMFKGCTKLSSITMLATEGLNKTNVFKDWVDGVADTGTFTKAASATIPEGVDCIPTGWTVVNK